MISDQMTSLRLLLTHQYSEFIDIKDFNCSKELKVQNIHSQTIWGWHVKLISNTLLFAVYMNSTLYYSNAFSYCPFEYFDKEWTYLHWIFWSRILRILLKYIWTHFFLSTLSVYFEGTSIKSSQLKYFEMFYMLFNPS